MVLACERDKSPPPPKPAQFEHGSYQDVVTRTQSGPATETRTELACSKQFIALSKEARREPKTRGALAQGVAERLYDASEAGASLTASERELLAVYDLDAETRNGGLHQFFFNSSGDGSLEARAGLERFGMTEALGLLDCALTAFPGNRPSKDREERSDQLARWGDKQFHIFETLTDAYYVVDDDELQRVETYVASHPAEFPNAGK
jgi:hypothetical protein